MSDKGQTSKVAALRGIPSPTRAEYMHKNAALYGVDLNNIKR